MTKNKKWKVCYNVDLQFYYPARSARYVQIGIVTKGYFTGYIHDYAGGGRWLRTWFLNGHRFELEDDDSRYDYVRKIARREIERVYPGLCTEINAILRRYVYWRDEVPYGTTLACNEELNCPAEEMIANGDMFPMNIGNTMFPHAMPELDCFVITSRGKVLTKREYERSEWENYPRRCYQPYPGTLYTPNRCRGITKNNVTEADLLSLRLISNDNLRKDIVPHPDCEWEVFAGFAQTFNPYQTMGINVEKLRDIAHEARAWYDKTGSIPADYSLSELRACLFFYHRAFYYAGKRKAPTNTEKLYLNALVEQIHLKAKAGRYREVDDDDDDIFDDYY